MRDLDDGQLREVGRHLVELAQHPGPQHPFHSLSELLTGDPPVGVVPLQRGQKVLPLGVLGTRALLHAPSIARHAGGSR